MKSQFNDGSSGHSHLFIYNNIQLKFYFFTMNFALFLKIKLYIISCAIDTLNSLIRDDK